MILLTVTAASWLTVACSSAPTPATSSPRPTDAAKIGTPRLVVEGRTSAEVTLAKVTYTATRPDGAPSNAGEYAILDLIIIGKSEQPFSVDLDNFYFQYTQQPDPYQPEDSRLFGVNPTDWSEFPHRLPIALVSKGKEISGTVPLEVSTNSLMLISMVTTNGTPVAQWFVTSH